MNARYYCLAVVLAAGSLSGCSSDRQTGATVTSPTPIATVPEAPAPPTAKLPALVQGVVLDFQTGRPIAGAVVAFTTGQAPGAGTETSVTDANGRYSLTEPPVLDTGRPARHTFFVNNAAVGSGYPRSTSYRADVAVDRGQCVARYGMVLDSRTLLPIVGATARSLSNVVRATTDRQGWYHIDWGCGFASTGFNTTWHIMSHPDYIDAQFASGRGISRALREDVLLTPR
jgi:hypothetical protein